jgi:hypothetical protein
MENEQKLLRASEEEEKRRALDQKRALAITAYEEEQAEQRKVMERERAERNAQRARVSHESQCQFKPVMTDDDMAKCRAIYR